MSEHTIHYYVEENYMTLFSSFSANFPAQHLGNYMCPYIKLTTRQIDGQNDNSVLTVYNLQYLGGYIALFNLSTVSYYLYCLVIQCIVIIPTMQDAKGKKCW